MNARSLSRRRFLGAAAVACHVAGGSARTIRAAEAVWTPIEADQPGPPARWDHTLAADETARRLVLFGGRDGNGVPLGDTWRFDLRRATWEQIAGQGDTPAARFGHAMAVDPVARAVYLFGGQSGDQFFNDVWQLDLATGDWTLLHDGSDPAPAPRYGLGAVRDASGRIIISHGFTFEGRFDDTWAFDPLTRAWADITPPAGPRPLKRCLHEQLWLPGEKRMLLYGGCSSGFGPCPQGDLWALDPAGGRWTELTPENGPAARSNPALAWHRPSSTVVLTGGLTDVGPSDELWIGALASDRFSWTQITATGPAPSPRSSHDAAVSNGRLYLFGGQSAAGPLADLWKLRLEIP